MPGLGGPVEYAGFGLHNFFLILRAGIDMLGKGKNNRRTPNSSQEQNDVINFPNQSTSQGKFWSSEIKESGFGFVAATNSVVSVCCQQVMS
jgi:hypothetical protein